MLGSVHCPKCATHYALRPPRVLPRHRRAKCFTCDHIFSIADQVQHLLAAGAATEAAETVLDSHGGFNEFNGEDAATIGVDVRDLNVQTATTTGISEEELHAAFGDEATSTAERPLLLPDASETFSEGPLTYLPPLTLQDLEEPDSSMEKTLVLNPEDHLEHRPFSGPPVVRTHSDEELEALGMGGPPPMPESLAESAPGTEDTAFSEGASTYSSARDAIDKLMAGTPSVQRARPQSMGMRGGAPMDVETTLDALELTLGGIPAPQFDSSVEPASTSVLSPMELDRAMSAQTAEPEPTASTRIMHREDLLGEDVSHQERTMMMPVPTLTPPPPPPPPSMPTVALSMPTPMSASMPPQMSPRASQEDAVKDPNLLKIQLETETLSNVAMDQLILLVELGRVKEYHLVARQFSENWLEANKVPALRPVFERLRRITQIGPAPTLANETAPVKKSLFGGLFGRN
ncbi:MAG: hypothetical protein IPP78_04545 [Holophagaceae bacterium]|nr:hypothetical protein [Holophagaceae bacterium]